MKLIGALLTTLGTAALALGQVWTLTSADFTQIDGTLDGITPAAVELRNSKETEILWPQIVTLEQRSLAATPQPESLVLYTRDGQRLIGAPVRLESEKLTWRSAWGEFQIALDEVSAWSPANTPPPAASANEDTVILPNGDVLRGIIEGSGEGLSVSQGTSKTEVKWESARGVSLAKIGDEPPAIAGLRIRLADGSVCLAKSLQLVDGELKAERASGAPLKLPLRIVQSIQNEAGRARFMAWLKPAELEYTPFTRFSEETPARWERLDHVVVDGRTYRDVIELRPKTIYMVASPVDGKFHLQYACGKAGQFTDMDLKVSVGKSVVAEVKGIRSAKPGLAIETAVKKGELVRLEVDYGQQLDVQDFLWLLDAAFIAR